MKTTTAAGLVAPKMISRFARQTVGLAILLLNIGWPQARNFAHDLAACLAGRPLAVSYSYTVSGIDFEKSTAGSLILADHQLFRVNLWDKVYSSEGQNLYLHDLNTRQTLIDSLRWQDLNIWIRIMQGEIPDETTVTPGDSSAAGIGYLLSNSDPWWEAQITIEPSDWHIRSLDITDGNGYRHKVELSSPVKQHIADFDSLFALLDLPGTRLDLR